MVGAFLSLLSTNRLLICLEGSYYAAPAEIYCCCDTVRLVEEVDGYRCFFIDWSAAYVTY